MAGLGLALLGGVAVLVMLTGLPVYLVLLVVSVLGAVAGVAAGVVPLALLGALPGRLIGLLENDLLQAVPLFVLVGALLNRLPLAELLYRCACRAGRRGRAAPRLAAVALSALLAPMNGSVGANVSMLARVVAPRLRERGADAAETTALVAVASTLGVLVPPSIVLLLLGDAMMAAHTQALTLGAHAERILNTQDLLHGVLPPALLVLALVGAIAAWQSRRAPPPGLTEPPLRASQWTVAALAVAALLALLGGVALGRFFAVEAAATGGLLLLAGGAFSGALTRPRLLAALEDALDITGSLFALFVAATSFTLVLRALGTDALVARWFAQLPGGPGLVVGVMLAGLLLCALVLDAFELIFVVVPIVMPPVLARVDDASWVAVLALLALQLSFALPPLGYAVMMSAARVTPPAPMAPLLRALRPYLLALAAVLLLVLVQPQLVHLLEAAPAAPATTLSPDEVERLMREASGK